MDRRPGDVLHHEERHPVLARTAVEQARDVRMLERGENLPFGAEAAEQGVDVEPSLDELEGDALLILSVGALREVDRAHSTARDFTQNAIWAEQFSRSNRP